MLTTKLSFVVPNTSTVIMNVYDAKGNLVAIPVNENKPAGVYSVNFDATSLPRGIYSYKVVVGNNVKTKNIVLDN
jgi:flagellar hook assembly protein FlgD